VLSSGSNSGGRPPLYGTTIGGIAPGPSSIARVFGLFALVVGTVVVMMAMRGVSVSDLILQRRRRRQDQLPHDNDDNGDGGVNGVEMFSISDEASGVVAVEGKSLFGMMSMSSPSELLGRIKQHKRQEFASVPTS